MTKDRSQVFTTIGIMWVLIGAAISTTGITGCSSAISEAQVANVESLRIEADEAFDAKNWVEAEEKYSASLSQGGLNPDLYADVLIKRAVCRGHLAEFETAYDDLAMAEQGAVSIERVHAARAFVLRSEGKISEADSELRMAQEIDPSVDTYFED